MMSIAEVTSEQRAPTSPAKPRLAIQVGARARRLRKLSGKTLKDIAQAMRTTPQTVQRLETGNMSMSLDWLKAYADALGVPAALLVVDDNRSLTDVTEDFICRQVDARLLATSRTLAAWLRDQAEMLDPPRRS